MNHDLQNVSFSSSDDEEEGLLVPSPGMISKYNREYSSIVKEIQRFLKEATQSVQKFVTFHNFGVDFNLPHLLNNLNFASQTFRVHLNSTKQTDHKDAKKIAKNRYELSFNTLIHRMSTLFKDMVDSQLQFKKSYFGNRNKHEPPEKDTTNQSFNVVNRSISSLTKSSTSQHKQKYQRIQIEAKEQLREAQLRATLNQRLKPKPTSCQPECKIQYSTTQNLYRLNQKIDLMLNDMKNMRSRQQKLIELFNLNRVKKIHVLGDESSSPLNNSTISSIAAVTEEDQDHEQMQEILEDWRGRQINGNEMEEMRSTKGFFKKRNIF